MKVFQQKQVVEAMDHAATGGQALHLHRIINNRRAPACFQDAIARGEPIAHLFDQDHQRLQSTARQLGVKIVRVERHGQRGQHVDLCGAPLRLAITQAGMEEARAKTPQERADEANKVIKAISNHGCRYFYWPAKNMVCFMDVDPNGGVWFVNHCGRVWTGRSGNWQGFLYGSTMQSLIAALRDYILTGKPIARQLLGPWPKSFCEGDLWGYGDEAMDKVRREVMGSEAVSRV